MPNCLSSGKAAFRGHISFPPAAKGISLRCPFTTGMYRQTPHTPHLHSHTGVQRRKGNPQEGQRGGLGLRFDAIVLLLRGFEG
jgi:hypothetical protein